MYAQIAVAVGSAVWGGIAANKNKYATRRAAKMAKRRNKEKTRISLMRHETQLMKILGGQRLAYAAAGVDVNAPGSIQHIMNDTKREAAIDAQLIKMNAAEHDEQLNNARKNASSQYKYQLGSLAANAAGQIASAYGSEKRRTLQPDEVVGAAKYDNMDFSYTPDPDGFVNSLGNKGGLTLFNEE